MDLVEVLAKEPGVSDAELTQARRFQAQTGGRLDRLLVSMGALDEGRLPQLFAEAAGLELVTSESLAEDADEKLTLWLSQLDEQTRLQLESNAAVPLDVNGENIRFAIADPFNSELNELLDWLAPANTCVIAPSDEEVQQRWLRLLHQQNPDSAAAVDTELDTNRLRELAEEAPAVNLVNQLLANGVKLGASDLHIEPVGYGYQTRYRIDGVLQAPQRLPGELSLAVISRIKILSGMDIAEKRRPQDGKIDARVAGQALDLRVSALPLGQGESLVLRFLLKQSLRYDLKTLGIADDTLEHIEADIQKTSGVVLLTGPTGSGKTTTLYSFLSRLNSPEVKIITLEDPIEYELSGINQVQVQSDIGFNFAKGLRSIVRQDPDIIMIGEIRDGETAAIAMQSALTGHLVFSTVHTNDAATAYTRLLDLGVDAYLLDAALVSVVAQRLARKLCDCAKPVASDEKARLVKEYGLDKVANTYLDAGEDSIDLREPVGCEACLHTGYKGRVALVEYLPCDTHIKSLSKDAGFIQGAQAHQQSLGMRNLKQDGFLKAILGITTVAEVLRVAESG